MSQLLIWATSDDVSPTLTLPSGMGIKAQFGTSTGIAYGTLGSGSYTATLASNGGWANTYAIAVFAVTSGNQYTYEYSAVSQMRNLTLPTGGGAYLGVLATGGAYPLTNSSITNPVEQTPSQSGGETDLIGQQASNVFSFATRAAGFGIAAVAIVTKENCAPVMTTISNVAVKVTSSNSNAENTVIISFGESSAATTYLYYGLNWTYAGYERGYETTTGTSFTLTYLNPGSTFDFVVYAIPSNSCQYMPNSAPSSFSTPAISQSGTVMGYVLNSSGSPIEGAPVGVSYSGGSNSYDCDVYPMQSSTTTSSSSGGPGLYAFPETQSEFIPGIGTLTCTAAEWYSDPTGYFEGDWEVATEPNSASGWNWQTFYLPSDVTPTPTQMNPDSGQDGVYPVLAFVNTPNVACQVQTGLEISTSIYGYAGGSGYTDTQDLTVGGSYPGGSGPSEWNDWGQSIGIADEFAETGFYSINPIGGATFGGAWVPPGELPSDQVGLVYTGSDPVQNVPPIGETGSGIAEGVGAESHYYDYTMTSSGSMTEQFGVETQVGLNLGNGVVGASVAWTLSFGIKSTQSNFVALNCYFNYPSSGYYWYEVYAQSGNSGTSASQGLIANIWQCTNDPTATSACQTTK
jgi:hypothetical protein